MRLEIRAWSERRSSPMRDWNEEQWMLTDPLGIYRNTIAQLAQTSEQVCLEGRVCHETCTAVGVATSADHTRPGYACQEGWVWGRER